MRFFLISDNSDAMNGLRLAGIEGTVARSEADLRHALADAANQPDIAVLLVTEKIAETYKRVRVAPLTEEDLQTYNMEDADELFGINYCARCQVCTAGCPARAINPDYIGPSHMLAVAFRHFDPYDQADRIVEAVQGGLWDCTMCGTCTAHCNQLEIDRY